MKKQSNFFRHLLVYAVVGLSQSCMQGGELAKTTPKNQYSSYAVLSGYKEIKSFGNIISDVSTQNSSRIEDNTREEEVSLVANQNYMMRLVNKEQKYEGILVDLYSIDGKKVATNLVGGQYYHGWSYKAGYSGKYVIKFSSEVSEEDTKATLSELIVKSK